MSNVAKITRGRFQVLTPSGHLGGLVKLVKLVLAVGVQGTLNSSTLNLKHFVSILRS